MKLFVRVLYILFVGLFVSIAFGPQLVQADRLTADDCSFIREAIEKLPDGGGEVVIPQGQYVCKSPIVLNRDHVSLRGEQKVILKLDDHVNAPLIVMGNIQTPPQPVHDVRVSNLELDGNKDQQDMECWGGECDAGGTAFIRNNGITVRGVVDGKIENVIVRAARSGGVVTEKGCYNLEINGLTAVDNYFDGFAGYETYGALLRNMNLSNNRAAGISIDIRFNDNVIRDTRIQGNGDVGVFMRDSQRNQFVNLEISQSGNHGIFLSHVEDDTSCANENEFENLTVLGSNGSGFRLNNACEGNRLTGVAHFAKNTGGCVSYGTPVQLGLQGELRCEP